MKQKILVGSFIIAFITSSLNMVDAIQVPNYVRGIAALLFLICIVVFIVTLVAINIESHQQRKQMMGEGFLVAGEKEKSDDSQKIEQ